MDQEIHVHSFATGVSAFRGHDHYLRGTTGRPRPLADGSHYHLLSAQVSTVMRHNHAAFGRTGPAVRLSHGQHFHAYQGLTSPALGHRHSFSGRTDRASNAAATVQPKRPARPAPEAKEETAAPPEAKKGFLAQLFAAVQGFMSGGDASGGPGGAGSSPAL